MASRDSWDAWKAVLLKWINGIFPEKLDRISFHHLTDGELFRRIIEEILKVNVKSFKQKDAIESFLRTEYPDVKLNPSSNEHELLLASILLHYWGVRLCESEYAARSSVVARLNSETEIAIRRFLENLTPKSGVLITEKQIYEAIETMKFSSTEKQLPSTPCFRDKPGSLRKFLNSPAAKQQKELAETQRMLREAMAEHDQEQLDRRAVDEELGLEKNKTRKLEAQLKTAMSDLAICEENIAQLQEVSSGRDLEAEIKNYKEEIKCQELYITQLRLANQPFEDENKKLDDRCKKLQEALQVLTTSSDKQEFAISELSELIKTKDKELEYLTQRNNELEAYVKGMKNDCNESTDFDTSLNPVSRMLDSPMSVRDTLPLSKTIVDMQLQEKQTEVKELRNHIDTAAEKISEIFSSCNYSCPDAGDILISLGYLEGLVKENNLRFVEEQRKLTETNLAQDAELRNTKIEIKSMVKRCVEYDERISEMNCTIEKNISLISDADLRYQQLSEQLLKLSQNLSDTSRELCEIKVEKLQLTESLEQTANNLATAEESVKSLKLVCDENDVMRVEMETRIIKKDEEITVLTGMQAVLREELEEVEKLMMEKDNHTTSIEVELQTTSLNLKAAKDELGKLSEAHHCSEAALQKTQLELDELLLRCSMYDEKVAVLTNSIEKKTEEIASVCQEREKLSEDLSESRAQVVQRDESLEQLGKEFAKAQSELHVLTLQGEEREKKIAGLQNANLSLKTDLSAMSSKNDDLRHQLEAATQVVFVKDTTITTLIEEKEAITLQLQNVGEERAKIADDYCTKDAEFKQSQSQVEELASRCRDQEAKISDMNESICNKTKEIAEIEEQRNLVRSKLSDMQDAEKQLRESLQRSETEIEIAGNILEQEVGKTTLLESTIAEKNSELSNLTGQYELLIQEVGNAQECLAEKQNQIHKLTEKCCYLESQLEAAIKEQTKLKEDFCSHEDETLKSHEKVKCDFESKIANMEETLNEKVEKISEIEEQRNLLDSKLAEMYDAEIKLTESFHRSEKELANACNTLEVHCKENNEEKMRLETSIAEKNFELSVLTNKHELLQQELEYAQQHLIEKQSQIEKSIEECCNLRSRLEELTEERTKLAEGEANLKESLRQTETELANTRENLELCCKEYNEEKAQLENSIANKKTEIGFLTDKHKLLQQEFESAQQHLVEKQVQIDKFIEDRASLNSQLEVVTEERTKLAEDEIKLKESLYQTEAELTKTRENLKFISEANVEKTAQLEKSIAERNAELVTLTDKHTLLQHGFESARQHLAENQVQIDKFIEDQASLNSQLEVVTEERTKLAEDEIKLKESLYQTEAELTKTRENLKFISEENVEKTAQLEKSIAERNAELVTLTDKHTLLQHEFESARQHLAENQVQIDKFIEDHASLNSQLEVVTEERTKLAEDKIKLKESLYQTKSELTKTCENLKLISEENDKKTAQLEKSIAERNAELVTLTDKHSLLQQEFESARQHLAENQAKIDKFIEDRASLNSQLEVVTEERTKLAEDEIKLKESLYQTQTDLSKTRENLQLISVEKDVKIAQLEKSIAERNAELSTLTDKHTLLQQEFESDRQCLAEQQNQISKFIEECGNLGSRLEVVIEERNKLTEDISLQDAEVKKLHSEIESLLLRCNDYEAKIADMNDSIAKKYEEIADIEEQRNIFSSKLVEAQGVETQLRDSLQQMKTQLEAVEEDACALRKCCAENDVELKALASNEATTKEQLSEITTKHINLLQEFNDINQQKVEKEVDVANLNNLVLNLKNEKNEFLAEKAAMSHRASMIAKEVEILNNENSSLKKEANESKSFYNQCLSQIREILSIDCGAEIDSHDTAKGSVRLNVYLQFDELLSKVGKQCEMYRHKISELKSVQENIESTWNSEFSRVNEQLTNSSEKERSAIASSVALEVRLKAVEENIVEECMMLTSNISDLLKIIDCADNSVLVNSSALSVPQPAAVVGFQHVQFKLSQLRDSITLLVNNKSSLFDDFCHVKEQLKEKVVEWQSLMSQVDSLTVSCDGLKADNVRLQNLLTCTENMRDDCRVENKIWVEKYAVVDEKVSTLEKKLVAVNSTGNILKLQARALQERNTELLADLMKKVQCCLEWETVCNKISEFKQMLGQKMEHLLLSKNQLESQLLEFKRKYDELNSYDLLDTANEKSVGSLKSEISFTLSSIEKKHNAVSLDMLNCIYSSLRYPFVLIQRQHRSMEGEDLSASPCVSHHSKDISVQIELIGKELEAMISDIQKEISVKIKVLEDNCNITPANNSFLDDSLEEKPSSSPQVEVTEEGTMLKTYPSDVNDPSTLAIQNVVESIVVSQARQFQSIVSLKNEANSLVEKNLSDFAEINNAKENLEKKIIEQQNNAEQLKEAYATLLQDCELAQTDVGKFRELLARKEEESQRRQERADQLEAQTRRLEEQITSCYTEEQVGRKVEKLAIEYEGKLERMKARMKDMFRTETAKLDELKSQACKEVEKQCKSELDNQIKKYKVYVVDQAHDNDDLKEQLQQEKMESEILRRQVARLENQLDARNTSVHPDPLVMKRGSVMEHLQRRGAEPPRVVRTHTTTSTTFERDEDPTSGYYRRQSIATQQSVTSLHNIPSESFAAEDEEGEVFNNTYLGDLKAGHVRLPLMSTGTERLGELQYRNSLCPPHLKSSYPAETQFHNPQSFRDEDVKLGFSSDIDHSDTSSLSALLLPGERQRKRDRGKNQTSYQKPGPPTPIKNGGRRSLQGGELLSPRAALREVNDGARAKAGTPSRIRQLFASKSKKDENSPMTPRGRRLSLFRKSARGREDC